MAFCRENSSWVLQNCSLYALGKVLRRRMSLGNPIVFVQYCWTLSDNFSALCQNIFVGVLKSASYVSNGTKNFQTTFPWLIVFLGPWERNKFPPSPKKVLAGVLTAINVSLGTFWRNNFWFWWKNSFLKSSSDISRKVFGIFSRFFWQVCQNCILRVDRNILKQNQNFLKKSSFSFWTFSEKFFNYWQNIPAGLSKLYSTCIWD